MSGEGIFLSVLGIITLRRQRQRYNRHNQSLYCISLAQEAKGFPVTRLKATLLAIHNSLSHYLTA